VTSETPKKFTVLLDWLAEKRVRQAEFARRLGLKRAAMSRLVTGRVKFIDPAVAVAIERETQGAVTAVDFITFMSNKEAA
jgi:hypothetical protein